MRETIRVYLSSHIPKGMVIGTYGEIDGAEVIPRVAAVCVDGKWVGDPLSAQQMGFSSEDYPLGLESLKTRMIEFGLKIPSEEEGRA